MQPKQIIKTIVPKTIWRKTRTIKDKLDSHKAERIQIRRFLKWISLAESIDKARVETRLAFDIHRLEKGLSHVQFRCGFGKGVLSEISEQMTLLEKADSNYAVNPLYQQGLSDLHEYQRRHTELNYDLTQVEATFPDHVWRSAQRITEDNETAGSFVMDSSRKRRNLSVDFIQIAQNRYSVREYSSESVSQELLDKVYEVSMKTPSVCNRQATRVYQITNLEKLRLRWRYRADSADTTCLRYCCW